MTIRHQNPDVEVLAKLDRVIRGTAQDVIPVWATTRWQSKELDGWIRMRVRAMWRKRKRLTNNYRLPKAELTQLGLLSLERFCWG